ncbi:MAG: hypoxanthine phosphoribosyltransferase [Bacteroidetes bacterium]|nr:hypoxanthine phosphoribosyltransferase [Bacteroidota bacterium]
MDEAQIQERVQQMARDMERDYLGKRPIFVTVLNGAIHFASDLTRNFKDKCDITFVKYSSYKGTKSTGTLQCSLGIQESIFGRHIILLEDIVDTGLTIAGIFEELSKQEPLSIRVATLLYKPKAMKHTIQPDYVGFEIENEFVVGYGMDYNGLGRNLPEIYKVSED